VLQPSFLNCPANPHGQAWPYFPASAEDDHITFELRGGGNIPIGRTRQTFYQFVFVKDRVSHESTTFFLVERVLVWFKNAIPFTKGCQDALQKAWQRVGLGGVGGGSWACTAQPQRIRNP
jgi:hypothetical protein